MSQHPDRLIRNMQRLAQHSKIPSIRERLLATGYKRESQLQKSADTFGHSPFLYLPSDQNGWWEPGTLPDGRGVRLTPPTGLTILVGAKGAGKSSVLCTLATHAWRQAVPVVFFDNKHGPQVELPMPLPQLTPLEAAISFGKQGDWLSSAAALELFAAGLESVAYVHSGILHLHDAAADLFKRQPDTNICLPQLVAALRREHHKTRQYSKQQQLESVINALRRVLGPDGELFAGVRTIPIERRFQHSHLIHLVGEPPEAKRLAINLLRQMYLRYSQWRGFNDRSLHWLVIADDARQLLSEINRKGAVAVDQTQDLLDRAQSSGQGLVVATQSLTELPQGLVQEADLVILLAEQIPADIQMMSRRMRLSDPQRQYLQLQPPYQAVFHHRQGCTEPYPVAFTPPEQALLPAEQLRAIKRKAKPQLLAGTKPSRWAPASETAAADGLRPDTPSGDPMGDTQSSPEPRRSIMLASDARQLLRVLCEHPHLLQSEAYEVIGSKGHRRLGAMMTELEGQGLVKVHQLANCKPVEALPSVEELGLTAPVLDGRGGYVHRWLCRRVAAYHRAVGNAVKLEFAWQKGRFDAWVRNPAGDVLLVEVMLSLSNLEATLIKIAGYASAGVTIICRDRSAEKKIKAAIKHSEVKLTVEVLSARTFLLQTKRTCLEAAVKEWKNTS